MIANEINYFLFEDMTGRHILIGFFTFRLRSQQLMGILIYIFFPFSSNLLFDCLLTFTHLFIYLFIFIHIQNPGGSVSFGHSTTLPTMKLWVFFHKRRSKTTCEDHFHVVQPLWLASTWCTQFFTRLRTKESKRCVLVSN